MAKRPISRVLVLSAHRGQVDRRILAEVNALAGTGVLFQRNLSRGRNLPLLIETYNIGRTYSMRSADQIARAIDNCVEQYRNGAFSSSSLAAAREDFAWKNQESLLIDLYNTLGV